MKRLTILVRVGWCVGPKDATRGQHGGLASPLLRVPVLPILQESSSSHQYEGYGMTPREDRKRSDYSLPRDASILNGIYLTGTPRNIPPFIKPRPNMSVNMAFRLNVKRGIRSHGTRHIHAKSRHIHFTKSVKEDSAVQKHSAPSASLYA